MPFTASALPATRRALVEIGPYSLDLTFAADADLDGAFAATCNDTGEKLVVSGWLIDSIEWLDEAPLAAAA